MRHLKGRRGGLSLDQKSEHIRRTLQQIVKPPHARDGSVALLPARCPARLVRALLHAGKGSGARLQQFAQVGRELRRRRRRERVRRRRMRGVL